ncbi:MAG: hypothetical protein HY233_14285 [Acidobacteriales bacterium]|nr:hypothetical protein [Terriglobales bacterium]
MMTKNSLFAVALLSLALCAGCATGGGGHSQGIQVTVSNGNVSIVGVTLTVQFTATVTGTSNTAVTWSVSGSGCTGNACGTINSSGLYTAPTVAPNPADVKIVATSQADTSRSGSLSVTVMQITVVVTPKLNNPLEVGKGLTQQFTAIAIPDAAPQTFTWTLVCDAGPNLCGALDPGTGLYTAPSTIPNPATAHVIATSTIDSTGSDTVDITIVKSRLSGLSTYAFRFSGFDANGPIAVAGNFATDSNGGIIGGTEDELTSNTQNTRTITAGTLSADSNVHGTLTLTTSAGARTYKVVFNAVGDGKMIEFDGTGRRGSGEIAQATPSKFKNSALPSGSSFVFGLTGVDTVLKRAGFVGLFRPDGVGAISSGRLDINLSGTASSSTDVIGTYNIQSDGRGTMTLTNNTSGLTYDYAIYMVGGQTNKANNPLTLFVISTDGPQNSPAVSGTIVFQDPTPAYVDSDFTGFTVSSLTGVDSNGNTLVSLTNAAGNGNTQTHLISGIYDANNAGQIVPAKSFSYSYAATPPSSSGKGRYELDLLGDPAANPVVPPVHFVLYSSAASRGFLLDQSSPAVYTGQMDLQPGANFARAELAGSFAAANANSVTSGVIEAAMNLLFTSDLPDFTVGGKQDETDGGQNAGQTLAGSYTVNFDGTGTINLTQPGAVNYVIYLLDNPKLDNRKNSAMVQHFVMFDKTNTNSSIIFAER